MAGFGSRRLATLTTNKYYIAAQSTKMSPTVSISMSSFTSAKMLKYLLLYYYLICEYKLILQLYHSYIIRDILIEFVSFIGYSILQLVLLYLHAHLLPDTSN